MKILRFIIAFILVSCSSDDSQTTTTTTPFLEELDFIQTLGGTKNESAQSVTKTSDGGYAILGYTQSMDGDIIDKQNESFDYWLLKYDATNTLQWNRTYGGTGNDRGNSIIQTNDGGYAILGASDSSDEDVTENNGSQDYWLAKLDPTGTISWQKSHGFSGGDNGISVIQTQDNGYLLIGEIDVSSSGGLGNDKQASRHAGGDYWAIKLDANGNKEWRHYFGGSFTDTPFGVIETQDNSFIIAGSSDSNDIDINNNKGSYDFWVIKISNTGNLIWEKSFGGTEIDEASGITETSDGNFMIVGNVRSNDVDVLTNNGGADLWLIKISTNGDLISEKSFGGTSFDVGKSIKKTQDNGFLIAGNSRSTDGDLTTNNGQNDAWVLKLNENTEIQWQKTFGGTDFDFAFDVAELNDGTVVLVGETNSNDIDIPENKGFTDLLIIKIK